MLHKFQKESKPQAWKGLDNILNLQLVIICSEYSDRKTYFIKFSLSNNVWFYFKFASNFI